MTPNGPLYCETGHPWLFMAEPVNTITNIFIVLAAIMATRAVARAKIGWPVGIMVLLALLFATGIGSAWWHGTRERVALAFDAIPGLLFLFAFACLWMRALWGSLVAVLGVVLLFAAAAGSVWAGRYFVFDGGTSALMFAPAFAVISLAGLGLVAATGARYGSNMALRGIVIMMCAISAAVFRSIDLMMCAIVPFGTHFLWHILLSTAAYLGITMLVRMKTASST